MLRQSVPFSLIAALNRSPNLSRTENSLQSDILRESLAVINWDKNVSPKKLTLLLVLQNVTRANSSGQSVPPALYALME